MSQHFKELKYDQQGSDTGFLRIPVPPNEISDQEPLVILNMQPFEFFDKWISPSNEIGNGIEQPNAQPHSNEGNDRDPLVEKAFNILNEDVESAEFEVVEPKKKKGRPYEFVHGKIFAKMSKPVKFSLKGAAVCQVVEIQMKYTGEQFRSNPVHPCKKHRIRDDDYFIFSYPQDNEIETAKIIMDDRHPTLRIKLSGNCLSESDEFGFFLIFSCLNSCHKDNGKTMEILFKLLDPKMSKVITEKRLKIKICENINRDIEKEFGSEGSGPLVDEIKETVPLKTDVTDVDSDIDSSRQGLDMNEEELQLNEEPTPKKRRKTTMPDDDDYFDTFGKYVGNKLREVPNEMRIYAEKLIGDVLFEGELEQLNRRSRVVV